MSEELKREIERLTGEDPNSPNYILLSTIEMLVQRENMKQFNRILPLLATLNAKLDNIIKQLEDSKERE